jgi:hypothetical protein
MEDVIIMTRKQLTRYDAARKAIGGVVTVKDAAAVQGAPEACEACTGGDAGSDGRDAV